MSCSLLQETASKDFCTLRCFCPAVHCVLPFLLAIVLATCGATAHASALHATLAASDAA